MEATAILMLKINFKDKEEGGEGGMRGGGAG